MHAVARRSRAFLALALFVSLLPVSIARAAATPLDAPQWTKVFGGVADGWTPACVKALRAGMTPAEAAAVLPGADKVSKFGFAKLDAKDVAGVQRFELYFRKPKKDGDPVALASVTLVLDARADGDDATYAALIKVLEAKYGAVKKPDAIAKKEVTWVSKGRTAQVWKIGRDLTVKVAL